MPGSNTTLYAKWSINQYTISFEENGGSVVTDITADFATSVTAPSIPSKEGYTFGGWYVDAGFTEAYTFTTMPASNITLYAKWSINQYTISFEENGGSVVTDITADFATSVTQPSIPSKEGYTFAGWYSDALLTQAYTFTTMPASNITVYAKWSANFTLLYQISGSEAFVIGISIDNDYSGSISLTIPNTYTPENSSKNYLVTTITSSSFVSTSHDPQPSCLAMQ
jgi:uncharacterized repeat protein (TIGR02543 family)